MRRGKLTGDLTIHGTTQPVTLDVTFNGFGPDPLTKQDTLGFSAEGISAARSSGLRRGIRPSATMSTCAFRRNSTGHRRENS